MKRILSFVLTWLLLAALLLPAGIAAEEETPPEEAALPVPAEAEDVPDRPVFSDVAESDWFYEPVEYLTSAGILRGFPDGTFRPGETLTRGQFLKLMLSPLMPEVTEPEGKEWWRPYVDFGLSEGILTQGDAEDLDKPMKRHRMARLLARLSLLPEIEGALVEVDREEVLARLGDLEAIPSFDLEAVIAVYGAGLIQGYDDGCFHPERTMTRAEAAMLFYRCLLPELRQPLLRVTAPEAWFDDALLLGNSLCGGLSMYGDLPEPDVLYSSGGSIFGSPDGLYHDRSDEGYPLWQKLGEKQYGKIILIYGTNEMYYDAEYFYDHYAAFLDRLEALQPQAQLWLCTAPPVNERLAQKEELTKRNCRMVNAVIRELAAERGLGLLDVWSLFADEDGDLPSSCTWDGIHLTPESCLRWTQWLRTEVLQPS